MEKQSRKREKTVRIIKTQIKTDNASKSGKKVKRKRDFEINKVKWARHILRAYIVQRKRGSGLSKAAHLSHKVSFIP